MFHALPRLKKLRESNTLAAAAPIGRRRSSQVGVAQIFAARNASGRRNRRMIVTRTKRTHFRGAHDERRAVVPAACNQMPAPAGREPVSG